MRRHCFVSLSLGISQLPLEFLNLYRCRHAAPAHLDPGGYRSLTLGGLGDHLSWLLGFRPARPDGFVVPGVDRLSADRQGLGDLLNAQANGRVEYGPLEVVSESLDGELRGTRHGQGSTERGVLARSRIACSRSRSSS